jgi:hypothetical protein
MPPASDGPRGVEGEGFVRPRDVADPLTPPPSFDEIGEEYVRQIVDLSPGQRKRYLGQLQVLARTPVRGALPFARPVTAISEAQLKTWLIEWDRSLKTNAVLTDLLNIRHVRYGSAAYIGGQPSRSIETGARGRRSMGWKRAIPRAPNVLPT